MHARGISAFLAILTLLLAAPAGAKSERVFSYRAEDVWPTLLRFLRVDEGLKIVEKDADAGYVLFELTENKRTFSGAAETVRAKDERGRPATRVQIRITDRPSYMEVGMLDRLEQKLRAELADPGETSDPSADAGPR